VTLEDHRTSGVAEGRGEQRGGPQQLAGPPGDVDAHQGDDADEADHQPSQPLATDSLGGVEAQRQQGDEQRSSRDDDRRQRRIDALFTCGDEREGHHDLESGGRDEPAQAAPQGRQRS
jgi:hypothetical protein